VDGYHSFGALPLDLGAPDVRNELFFVGGVLKHCGAGCNLTFMTVPDAAAPLAPLLTGWLADPSCLGAGPGVVHGGEVIYARGSKLRGGTPAFFPCMILFNAIRDEWVKLGVDVGGVHSHVMEMQNLLFDELSRTQPQHSLFCLKRLASVARSELLQNFKQSTDSPDIHKPRRSHTLAFKADSPEAAAAAVASLAEHGIAVDCRRNFVRVGIGPNHSAKSILDLAMAIMKLRDAEVEERVTPSPRKSPESKPPSEEVGVE
jgi:hypothetical protein